MSRTVTFYNVECYHSFIGWLYPFCSICTIQQGGFFMQKKRLSYLFFILTFILVPQFIFANEVSPSLNASKWGLLTILPPLIAIILALVTKNVVLSLFVGVFSGSFMLALNGNHVFDALIDGFGSFVSIALNSLADPWNAGIVLQVLTIGGLIALVGKLGGTRAVAEALAKHAKSARSTQMITWLLGLFIFFDDYANALIVGPIMRPVCDKQKISREKLSFIVDATSAPVAGLMIISTWIGYELSVIKDAFATVDPSINPFSVFLQTLPYRFYNILMLLFIVFTALLLREFGPMLKAERRARHEGKVLRDGATPMVSEDMDDLEPVAHVKLSIWNAIIPIGTLIVASLAGFYFNGRSALLAGEDMTLITLMKDAPLSLNAIMQAFGASDASIVLFQSALIASILTMIMGLFQKAWNMQEAIDIWVKGMKSLIITGVILILAWSLSTVIKDLGTAIYLSGALQDHLPSFLLPSLIFILGSLISFATGTSYGTMGILMPLAIPIAYTIGGGDYQFTLFAISAVLSGAILGDHCSPISDTTILSSMGSGADHIDHVKTQLLYAMVVGALSIICGYLPLALGVPFYIVMPVAILVLFLIVRFVGKPVESN